MWTTRFTAGLLTELSAEAKTKLLRAQSRALWRTYMGKLLANPA